MNKSLSRLLSVRRIYRSTNCALNINIIVRQRNLDHLTFSQHYHAEKEEPQPQVVVAFGLRITNCAPDTSSL